MTGITKAGDFCKTKEGRRDSFVFYSLKPPLGAETKKKNMRGRIYFFLPLPAVGDIFFPDGI